MRPVRVLLCTLALLASVCASAAEPLTVTLRLGGHDLVAEVAHTEPARATGLMYRRQLPADAGMLFVFPRTELMAMWMRNTYVPLSVAFIDERGVIINIADMTPQTEDIHPSSAPGRYALEVNRGWFAKYGIGPGTRVEGLERAPAPR
jgi:uncharacterized membrane protein (UPF0127 family)